MKITAIIQARENSTRFPKKVLKTINSKSILEIIYLRLKKSKLLSDIIFAVPKKDKEIIKLLKKKKFKYFCGSENNVLQRYYLCAKENESDVVVRITADCPFVDFKLLDKMIKKFKKNKFDYLSNTIEPLYPDGFDIEIFNFESLLIAYKKSTLAKHFEHVTFYITDNQKKFKISSFKEKQYLDYSNIRLTLDNHLDLEVIKDVYKKFKFNFLITYDKIYKLIQTKPELFDKNKHFVRNYGMIKNKKNLRYTFNKSEKIIPTGNQMLSKNPMSILPYQWPMYYKKAKGCNIWDTDGKKYYDFSLMGVGANLLGYANDKIDRFVKSKINLGSMSTLNCFEEYDLAEELLKIDKWADMVRFAKTGGEINSIAIRIARAASGKNGIAFCGYHGWHDWYLSANLANKKNLNTHLMNGFFTSGVPKNLKNTSFPFEFNNIKSLKKVLAKNPDIGVIKMEVYRNHPPHIKFLKEIRKICNKKKLVLIFDECTSGFRGNYGGIYKNYNVQPDIVLYGKALGNGYPITACVGRREVMETANNSFISSTFWSERVGFSAALATLKEMRRIKSWQKVEKVGLILRKGIKKIAKDNNIKINFFGLPAITSQIIDNKNSNLINSFITQEMLKKGFLSTDSIYASISHNKKNIETYLENLNDVFKVVSQHKDDKNFLKLIEGPLPIKPFNRMN